MIGANLGAFDRLVLEDYVLLVAVICLIVLYLHLAPAARRCWSHLAYLALLLAGLYILLVHDAGATLFEGPRPAPHVFATICFWIASIVVIELRPVSKTP